jgi:hypothetical protein
MTRNLPHTERSPRTQLTQLAKTTQLRWWEDRSASVNMRRAEGLPLNACPGRENGLHNSVPAPELRRSSLRPDLTPCPSAGDRRTGDPDVAKPVRQARRPRLGVSGRIGAAGPSFRFRNGGNRHCLKRHVAARHPPPKLSDLPALDRRILSSADRDLVSYLPWRAARVTALESCQLPAVVGRPVLARGKVLTQGADRQLGVGACDELGGAVLVTEFGEPEPALDLARIGFGRKRGLDGVSPRMRSDRRPRSRTTRGT